MEEGRRFSPREDLEAGGRGIRRGRAQQQSKRVRADLVVVMMVEGLRMG